MSMTSDEKKESGVESTACMMTMSLDEVARSVGGVIVDRGSDRSPDEGRAAVKGAAATSVVSDSRRIRPGSVFVAIKGERVDGHRFVAAAGRDGAVAAIVSSPVAGADVPQIQVADTVEALGALARHNIERRRSCPGAFNVIGITGSVGKTTTKDLLKALLETVDETVAPVGSFNNEIGLPLTALEVNERTRFLIAEMGANHVGEIANLTTIVPPDIAVVLKVGVAHLGEFGSVERIAQAKSEIVRGLVDSGTAVLNADDERVAAMASIVGKRELWFGVDQRDDRHTELAVRDITVDSRDRASFILRRNCDGGEGSRVTLGIPGRHNVINALAAATVAFHCGMDVADIARILCGVRSISPHRMAVSAVGHDGVDFTLIDDSFNANPDSMKAGIDGLRNWNGAPGDTPFRVAVLGAMLELGADESDLHRQVGAYAARQGIDAVVVVGSERDEHLEGLAAALADGARDAGAGARDASSVDLVKGIADADAVVRGYARRHPGTVVLLKGSHASGLSTLAERWDHERLTV
jgi:UDP-N-acetylmuramoyl-tripeptide--D-alanyl-D-alanine ligase